MVNIIDFKPRPQTAQQKLNNFLRSNDAKTYPLTPSMVLVLHALSSYFYYNETCWPSIASLHDYCMLGRRCIMSNLKKLAALGLIQKETKNGASTIYKWSIPDVKDSEVYQIKSVDKKQTNVHKLGNKEKPVPKEALVTSA